jgi:hypothetical protein
MSYLPLQVLRLLTALSIVVFFFAVPDLDLEKLTTTQAVLLLCLGLLNILGRLSPFLVNLAIDEFKESLQATLATRVVRKIFELEHSAVLMTPTGEFSQLIAKIFRNLDTLLPALYGQILPVGAETMVAILVSLDLA